MNSMFNSLLIPFSCCDNVLLSAYGTITYFSIHGVICSTYTFYIILILKVCPHQSKIWYEQHKNNTLCSQNNKSTQNNHFWYNTYYIVCVSKLFRFTFARLLNFRNFEWLIPTYVFLYVRSYLILETFSSGQINILQNCSRAIEKRVQGRLAVEQIFNFNFSIV